jgi:hypothetical protein
VCEGGECLHASHEFCSYASARKAMCVHGVPCICDRGCTHLLERGVTEKDEGGT